MRAGELRHRVQIQEQTVDRTASGAEDPDGTWRTVARRWAEVLPAGGGEAVNAQQVQAVATHTVRMRWWDGLRVEHRIKFGSRVFSINAIDDVGTRRVEMMVRCTEVPAEEA